MLNNIFKKELKENYPQKHVFYFITIYHNKIKYLLKGAKKNKK
tara:strand:- start:41 stop:169 length:129 start_codon:yes stop_codon:yes gene_type:complete